mmetsp:Transcript_57777/g.161191  ORF Transcript_57777/g.161191 Transcript_57777/m.161191 type:complete len:267 (+) Transcript_57777:208-1008(+)
MRGRSSARADGFVAATPVPLDASALGFGFMMVASSLPSFQGARAHAVLPLALGFGVKMVAASWPEAPAPGEPVLTFDGAALGLGAMIVSSFPALFVSAGFAFPLCDVGVCDFAVCAPAFLLSPSVGAELFAGRADFALPSDQPCLLPFSPLPLFPPLPPELHSFFCFTPQRSPPCPEPQPLPLSPFLPPPLTITFSACFQFCTSFGGGMSSGAGGWPLFCSKSFNFATTILTFAVGGILPALPLQAFTIWPATPSSTFCLIASVSM